MSNPTDEQIEAQASADHERRIEEAEMRVIAELCTAANEMFLRYCVTGPDDEITMAVRARLKRAVDALNALTTPVESLPEKVEEWEGFVVFESGGNNLQTVLAPSGIYFYRRRGWAGWTNWLELSAKDSLGLPLDVWTNLHGPARLEVLKSLPDELVKAAKGVDCGN